VNSIPRTPKGKNADHSKSSAVHRSNLGMSDYLKVLHSLIKNKGYAKSVDVSSILEVQPSTVTSMLQKLHESGFVIYEKYRGVVLTKKGNEMAKNLTEKHKIVYSFFTLLGVNRDSAQKEAETSEHVITPMTLDRMK